MKQIPVGKDTYTNQKKLSILSIQINHFFHFHNKQLYTVQNTSALSTKKKNRSSHTNRDCQGWNSCNGNGLCLVYEPDVCSNARHIPLHPVHPRQARFLCVETDYNCDTAYTLYSIHYLVLWTKEASKHTELVKKSGWQLATVYLQNSRPSVCYQVQLTRLRGDMTLGYARNRLDRKINTE